jgi:hypothetical protein
MNIGREAWGLITTKLLGNCKLDGELIDMIRTRALHNIDIHYDVQSLRKLLQVRNEIQKRNH